jgi:type I restriction enzyme, R subunit
MQSKKFKFLRANWPELASLGGCAKAYLHTDPSSSLVKLRIFAENVAKYIYYDLKLQKEPHCTFLDHLNNGNFKSEVPSAVRSRLNALRIPGKHARIRKFHETG